MDPASMNTIFTDKPWQNSHAEIDGMPTGMLGRLEGALLYFLCRDFFQGFGEIIDAGSFLGASSFCLARGLEDNTKIKSKSGRLHAYDLFEVWLEQETTEKFMASELKRIFNVDVGDHESTLHIYTANLGALARHIRVYRGDILQNVWCGRPIEILFIDICKSRRTWQHVLKMFYPSLIPGHSVVVHQDYHHPLLPFIHVVHEKLAPYFDIVDVKADDSTTFLLSQRFPDNVLNQVSSYDFDFRSELKLMDGAIERLNGQNQHLKIAKSQLLRQNGYLIEARRLIDQLKEDATTAATDPKYLAYIGFVESNLLRDEARAAAPAGFDEEAYLDAN